MHITVYVFAIGLSWPIFHHDLAKKPKQSVVLVMLPMTKQSPIPFSDPLYIKHLLLNIGKLNQSYGFIWLLTYTQHNVLFRTQCRIIIWLVLWWFGLFGAGTFTTNTPSRERWGSRPVQVNDVVKSFWHNNDVIIMSKRHCDVVLT